MGPSVTRRSSHPIITPLRALWKALRSRGIPIVLTDLIAALHENTLAAIRVWKNKSNKASEKVLFELKVKGKVFPYSLPSVGPGADPGVQAVSPQVT